VIDAPIDAPYVFLGVAAVSLVAAGVGAGFPTGIAPDAANAADTVDRVAASQYPATAEHPIDADRVRIGPNRIALRDDSGTTHATFAFGPVTPAADGPLRRVLEGALARETFDSPAALDRVARRARDREPTWTTAGDRILVRTVTWRDVHVTIVGA
jgi:hypothetical protein